MPSRTFARAVGAAGEPPLGAFVLAAAVRGARMAVVALVSAAVGTLIERRLSAPRRAQARGAVVLASVAGFAVATVTMLLAS